MMIFSLRVSLLCLFLLSFASCKNSQSPNHEGGSAKTKLNSDGSATDPEPNPDPSATGCCFIRSNSTDVICSLDNHDQSKCNQTGSNTGSCAGKFQSGYAIEFRSGSCSNLFGGNSNLKDKRNVSSGL